MTLLKDGYRQTETYKQLFLSWATMKREVRIILDKLNSSTVPQAVSEAYQRRIFKLKPKKEIENR